MGISHMLSNNARQLLLIAGAVAAILAVGAGSALAVDTAFTNANGTWLWNDAANWSAGIPTTDSRVDFVPGADGTITVPVGAVGRWFINSYGNAVNLSGGSITVGDAGDNLFNMGGNEVSSNLLASVSGQFLQVQDAVILSGDNSGYDGGMYLNTAGQVTIASNNGIPGYIGNTAGGTLALKGGITTAASASYGNWSGSPVLNASFLGLAGANVFGGAVNDAFSMKVDVISGASLGFAGGYSVGGLTKIGDGTMSIDTYDSAINGAVAVSAGTLLVNVAVTGSSGITVDAGATLGGKGSTDGTVNLSGTVAPGASIGVLVTGDQIWNDGASFALQIGDAAGIAGTDWDALFIANGTGMLDLSGLSVGGFEIAVDTSAMINFTPGQSFDFALANNGIAGFDANKFTVTGLPGYSVKMTGGSLLSLTAVPEPGTLALLIAGAMGLAIWARKKRK